MSSDCYYAVPLVIASGTPYETDVIDVRWHFPWAQSSGHADPVVKRYIILHHTATPTPLDDVISEIMFCVRISQTARYGLPYNFAVFPSGCIYYLNDVDRAWPHTLNLNGHTAIAAVGNYQVNEPNPPMLNAIERLMRALREMWAGQHEIELLAHREAPGNLTLCPGDSLYEWLKELRERW